MPEPRVDLVDREEPVEEVHRLRKHAVVEAEQALVQVLPLLLAKRRQPITPLSGVGLVLAVGVGLVAPAHKGRLQLQERAQFGQLLRERSAVVQPQQLLLGQVELLLLGRERRAAARRVRGHLAEQRLVERERPPVGELRKLRELVVRRRRGM